MNGRRWCRSVYVGIASAKTSIHADSDTLTCRRRTCVCRVDAAKKNVEIVFSFDPTKCPFVEVGNRAIRYVRLTRARVEKTLGPYTYMTLEL